MLFRYLGTRTPTLIWQNEIKVWDTKYRTTGLNWGIYRQIRWFQFWIFLVNIRCFSDFTDTESMAFKKKRMTCLHWSITNGNMLNTERSPLCLIVASVQGKMYSIDKTLHCIRDVRLCLKLCFTKTQVQSLNRGGETFPALKKKMRSNF